MGPHKIRREVRRTLFDAALTHLRTLTYRDPQRIRAVADMTLRLARELGGKKRVERAVEAALLNGALVSVEDFFGKGRIRFTAAQQRAFRKFALRQAERLEVDELERAAKFAAQQRLWRAGNVFAAA